MKKKASVYIYHENGKIYMVRVLLNGEVSEFPVTNTSRKTIVRTMKELYGKCEFNDVFILGDRQ